MNPQTLPPEPRKHATAGIILILIGLLILAGEFIQSETIGLLFLPTLGLIFLAWGLLNRSIGLLIPGGILLGIGLGAFLIDGAGLHLDGVDEGAIFLLAFASGWALITLLSPLTKQGLHWWPLIPGGIIASIGLLLMAGDVGERILSFSNYIWPLALILFGISILLRKR
ncbi:MAG: hypothetical protein GXP38_08300 [Chloroflexi bacterium]|nr:hypothetical protein [Chloroflexota bacterium]